jgi:glycosyltransferase involved in cell wall biosynthesis
MKNYSPVIYVALPAMNEADYITDFIACLKSQIYNNYKLFVCVNQPDNYWDDPDKVHICKNNKRTIEFLKSLQGIDIEIIDKSSRGEGWKGKKNGVGWARKLLMDKISHEAKDDDLIVSLDADTTFSPHYFSSLIESFKFRQKAVALSVPYYHNLTGDEIADRAILRYEIYLRYYNLNMLRIGSPYAFTAIGSAIVLPVKSYKAIGGMTPHKSGEDFYFLQKLRKYGDIILWNSEKVFPAARFSDRVDFGTGPAMIKGRAGDWSSYPIYPFQYFDEIKQLFDLFPGLYEKTLSTPVDTFLEEKFGNADIWSPLRKNSKKKEQFIKACHHKFDAFRSFQYLKWRHENDVEKSSEENLIEFINIEYTKSLNYTLLDNFNFSNTSIKILNDIRDFLLKKEEVKQKKTSIKSE